MRGRKSCKRLSSGAYLGGRTYSSAMGEKKEVISKNKTAPRGYELMYQDDKGIYHFHKKITKKQKKTLQKKGYDV